jgi:hypothetical protein
MKKSNVIISTLLALLFTVYLYWPLYQRLPIANYEADFYTQIQNIDFPIGDEIAEVLNRLNILPFDRHQLCLENNNQARLLHADSGITEPPLVFFTEDISKIDLFKENRIGAMAITLHYNNDLTDDPVYREIGQPKKCIILKAEKLRGYASSTIVYKGLGLSVTEELDLGEAGKFKVPRDVVKSTLIDTKNSIATIVPRWHLLILTLSTLFGIVYGSIDWVLPKIIERVKKKSKT